MTKIYVAILAVLTVFGVWKVAQDDGLRKLEVTGGRTTLSIFDSSLQAKGLKITTSPSAEGDSSTGEASVGFKIALSDLRFTLNNGALAGFNGGTISHKSGFKLSSGKQTLDASQFLITASKSVNDGLQVSIDSDKGTYVAFDLVHPRANYDVKNRQLVLASMDVAISFDGAQKLGRPDLAGTLVGTMSLFGSSAPIDGGGDVQVIDHSDDPGRKSSVGLDVSISSMGSLTSLGRIGTFPTGVNGFSMSTTSCNVGTVNIPWQAPMQVQHPVIAMNLYRIKDGKFEQIGWSWLKHGFLATNSSGCGSCQNPGTGALLGVGCSDTYGTGNNGDRNYLGGRDEVNPLTGVWTCQNSYFSNFQNDCVRRNNGSGLDVVAHRLEVRDADLNVSGSQFIYEANYILPNDIDRYNNAASREANITWNGNSWTISTINSQVQGPAINRYGDMRSTAQPRTDGDVIVAVKTTDLGNGMWHYEYAVYNHTLDRQIREFVIPVGNGQTVQNIGFHDIDQNGGNNWVGTYANNAITWSTDVFGSSSANPLKYASVFNFRFDTNVPPVAGSAQLGLFKPGTGTTLTADTKVPMLLRNVDSFSPVSGTVSGGNLSSLSASDNDYVAIAGDAGQPTGIQVTFSVSADTPVNNLMLGVESKRGITSQSPPPANQTIELWNWSTSQWELIDTRGVTALDSLAFVTVSSNPTRFINGSGQGQARIMHRGILSSSAVRRFPMFDQIGFQVN